MAIVRQPEIFSQNDYDLIIVGGGIYGVMLTLESVFRGLRPLMLEKNDFAGATSFNSLRIVHGGLRYLQTLDLRRYFESVRERRWFLSNFPDLAHPLPCLMPLYGKGVRRKSVFRAALLINDVLSLNRNDGVSSENALPGGKIASRAETAAAFPGVEQGSLQGSAIWYDAAIPDSQRVVMELLRWAMHYGAHAVNYMKVSSLSVEANAVRGVVARDRESGTEMTFRAPVVVNSTGPWSAIIAGSYGCKAGNWFSPTLAWNLLIDKPAPSQFAIAATPPRVGGPTYFLHPWKGRLLIGTGHSAWDGGLDKPIPSRDQIREMIDDINSAIPGFGLATRDVERVFAGLLPGAGPLSDHIATKPTMVDHSKSGGPGGFISICGVKFTTARLVAAKTLDHVFGDRRADGGSAYPRPTANHEWQASFVDFSSDNATRRYLDGIGRIVEEESAINLSDVVFRRTDLWERPDLALRLAPEICELFDWPEDRKTAQLRDLANELAGSAPRHHADGDE